MISTVYFTVNSALVFDSEHNQREKERDVENVGGASAENE